MSRRKTKDYTAVLQSIRARMPAVAVRHVTSIVERALWRAIAKVFPQTKHRGCIFHWTQVIYCKIQALELARQYWDDRHVHQLCRHVTKEIYGQRSWPRMTAPYLLHCNANWAIMEVMKNYFRHSTTFICYFRSGQAMLSAKSAYFVIVLSICFLYISKNMGKSGTLCAAVNCNVYRSKAGVSFFYISC